MNGAYQWWAAASSWWWPRFADHLWQSTIFAFIILGATLVLKRGPARRRHTLCVLASVKFLLPAALFFFLAQQTGIQLPFSHLLQTVDEKALWLVTEPAVTIAAGYEVTVFANDSMFWEKLYLALTIVWLAGTASVASLWFLRRRRFRSSLSPYLTNHAGREWSSLQRARESLGIKREVGLMISARRIEPGVWRVFRPIIILPGSMTSQLDDSELEAILVHELIHIQRHDNLIGNFQLALCALLWFHPLVWFVARKLFDEREQACDERVMKICNSPEVYASSILKVVRFCFGWRVAGVAGAASGTNLRRRIENIMNNANTNNAGGRVSHLLAGALVGLAVLFVIGTGVYSRPLKVNAVTRAAAAVMSRRAVLVNSDQAAMQAEAQNTEASADKSKQPRPPKPPQPAQPAQPPQPADKAQPAQPAQPTQPPQPPEPATKAADIRDNDAENLDKQKRSADKLEKGELIEAPQPVYPEEAKKEKIEGVVSVVITIGDEGNVIYAKARSGPEALHGASEAAALKARFKPTFLKGKPVKVSGVMSYKFVLDKKE